MQFKPKENIECTINGLGSSGEGVGKVSGFTFFIPGALPGERVQAQVTLVKKSYGQAKLVKVLVPSPDREKPPCPVNGLAISTRCRSWTPWEPFTPGITGTRCRCPSHKAKTTSCGLAALPLEPIRSSM